MADATVARRHALGLPEGSIRALLALMVVGLTCLLLLVPIPNQKFPPYLVLLLFLVVGHFFAGHAPGSFPLYIPINLLRLAIMGALGGAIALKLINDRDGFQAEMIGSLDEAKQHLYLPLLLLGGFFVGLIFRMIVGRQPSYFVQDLEAWLALLAVLGLIIVGFVHFINLHLEENLPITLNSLGGFLSVVIAFYYGARS